MATKPSFTASQAAEQITRRNLSWNENFQQPVTLTFGFRTGAPAYSLEDSDTKGKTIQPVTTSEAQAIRTVLANFSDIANITFVDTDYGDNATLLFADYSNSKGFAAGFAYMPETRNRLATSQEGDVYLNIGTIPPYERIGNYGWSTLVHETLHALGLEHPGNYDAAQGVSLTYKNNAEYKEDTPQYSIMSYFKETDTGANWRGRENGTPMIDDILALQRFYGANPLAGLGDTTYGFNANARPEYRLSSSSDTKVFCIYDPNGTNTLDFSGYDTNDVIDLRPGHFSSVGGLKDNVSIAYGSIVQRAVAGSGDCTLIASDAGCTLQGGTGANTFRPGTGTDRIIGLGSNQNVVYYNFERNQASFSNGQFQGVTITSVQSGTDVLTGISRVYFTDGFLDLDRDLDITSPSAAEFFPFWPYEWPYDWTYYNTFARTPDYREGVSLKQVANTLGRSPDVEGQTYGLDLLGQERLDRADWMMGLAQPDEGVSRTATATSNSFFCI